MQALEEAHSGVCGAHQSGPKLHFRIKRMGYYWPTMVKDYGIRQEMPSLSISWKLYTSTARTAPSTVASWPFDAWGLDVVGLLPKSSAGHLYILAATDYFSKWAEAVSLREVKKRKCRGLFFLVIKMSWTSFALISFSDMVCRDTSSPIMGSLSIIV